jgi:hypothetical protein
LQSCYDRPRDRPFLSCEACRVRLSTANPIFRRQWISWCATTVAKGNGHYRFTFQANNGEGRARNSRI